MNIAKTDSTDFRAKLNLSKVDSYQNYWNNVAKEFAKSTKGTRGELCLNSYKSYKSGINLSIRTKNSNQGYASVTEDAFKSMTNEPAKKTGRKLAKFFKIASPAIDENAKALCKMYKTLGETKISTHSVHNWEMFKNKHYTPIRNEINKKVENQIKNESDLTGFEILV